MTLAIRNMGLVVFRGDGPVHLDPLIVLGSAAIGLLVGITGAGGGALMTPMLIALFGVKASTAISSDLVAAVVMRPFGAAVHLRRGTVNLGLVGWLVLGSVPGAFLGAALLHLLVASAAGQADVERALGAALVLGAAAMVWRSALDARQGRKRQGPIAGLTLRPCWSVVIGAGGGLVVGLTSVGSGSLMIVALLCAYPALSAKELVGTDLVQAVPLTLAAALGALAFGHVELHLTASLILGGVPAVVLGAAWSSHAPDALLRPLITAAILASGLRYAGVVGALGLVVVATAAGAGATFSLVQHLALGSRAGRGEREALRQPGAGATPRAGPAPRRRR